MESFLAAFLFVVLAEMGDKTQLLAMAFATRYPAQKVLLAVFLATIINHGMAVTVGHFLTVYIPIEIISFIASLSFIFFGLWTLRGDVLSGEDKKPSRFGPVLTVGIAFFLAEMGDKTQLATISLAIEYRNMVQVLMGTTLGMVVADGFGIILGILMRKRIPERVIKYISATIFAAFGFVGMYGALTPELGIVTTLTGLGILAAGVITAAYFIVSKNKSGNIIPE